MSLGFAANITDHFGSKLLNEVLSHFSDLTPSAPRPKGHAEPKLSEWSSAECIERSRKRSPNVLRKYMVNAADRGKHCIGRPRATPSPTIFAEESFRCETPIRDRLPKSAQLFPVLVETGWTTNSMRRAEVKRPMSQQSHRKDRGIEDGTQERLRPHSVASVLPVGENKPLPFKHAAKPHLFGKHFRDFRARRANTGDDHVGDATSPLITLPAATPSPSPPPEADVKKSASDRKSTRFAQLEAPKAKPGKARFNSNNTIPPGPRAIKLKNAYASADDDDSEDDDDGEGKDKAKQGIWKVALASSKYDRLHRLNSSRKLKENEFNLGDRDKVVTGEDVELARDSFLRHFNIMKKNTFDRLKMVEALNDFGIRARNRQEKLVLFKILDDYVDSLEVTLKDFCSTIEDVRVQLRTCRYSVIFMVWREVDSEGVGGLESAQVLEILTALNLAPKTQSDTVRIEAYIEELQTDAFGLYPLGEVEYLVQQCRENMEADRRRRERHIQKQYNMAERSFKDFRSQILDLHEMFKRLDEDGSGTLDTAEIVHLLAEFGISAGLHTKDAKHRMGNDLQEFLNGGQPYVTGDVSLDAKTSYAISFPWFLLFVKTLRRKSSETRVEHVTNLFHTYDKDKSGALDMKEVCHIIDDLDLQPRTAHEQEGIAELLEGIDADGTGTFTIDELLDLFVRINEQKAQAQRLSENRKADAMGISRKQKFELRQAFETLDDDASGSLSLTEVLKAVQMMQWKVADNKIRDLMNEVDEDQSGEIDFEEFMVLMSRVDIEMKSENQEAETKPQPRSKGAATTFDSEASEVVFDSENSVPAQSPKSLLNPNMPRRGKSFMLRGDGKENPDLRRMMTLEEKVLREAQMSPKSSRAGRRATLRLSQS